MNTSYVFRKSASLLIAMGLLAISPLANCSDVLALGPHATSPVAWHTSYKFRCSDDEEAIVEYGRKQGVFSQTRLIVHGVDYATHQSVVSALDKEPIHEVYATCLPGITEIRITTYDEQKGSDVDSRIARYVVQISKAGLVGVTTP